MYVGTQCGGLHGHVKVAPDGTVYVPNRDCSGTQSVVVSEDNGVTWAIRPVNTCTYAAKPSLIGQGDDPALSIDASGRVYFTFSNFVTSCGVAVSEVKITAALAVPAHRRCPPRTGMPIRLQPLSLASRAADECSARSIRPLPPLCRACHS